MSELYKADRRDFTAGIPQEWSEAIKQLDLVWSASFEEKDVDTCKIISSPTQREHQVWIHPDVLKNRELYKVDVFHELCHAKLSEAVSPAFSTIHFKKEEYGGDFSKLSEEQKRSFSDRAEMLRLAWCHVDIWVNDLRHKEWPELTRQDAETFQKGVTSLASRKRLDILQQPESMLGIAMNKAETARHLRRGKKKVKPMNISFFDKRTIALINKLTEYYKKLPPLTMDKDRDLSILEISVQDVAKILGLPINPKLVKEDGMDVWSFE